MFAGVDRAILTPARAKIFSCRYSGRWSPYLATRTWANRPGAGMPLSITWGGTGAWTKASQSEQAHLPRTWRSTVKVPGI